MNTKKYLILLLLILPTVVFAQYSSSSTVKVEQTGVNYIHMDYINTSTGVYINDGETHILKNWTNNGVVNFTSGVATGETRFVGTAQQTISGTGTTDYQNILFENTVVNPSFLLQKEVNVYGNVDYTDGVVRESGAGLTIYQDGATHSNVSDASFVDGKVRKIGDDAFVFPIGDDDGTTFRYRNAAISAPAASTDSFDAQYFWDPTVHDVSLKQSTIDVIETDEYWQIDQVSGSSLVNLTLGWDTATTMPASLYADVSKLIIVRWDGSQWVNEGGVADASSSTITTTVSGYGTFALASLKEDNGTIPDYKPSIFISNTTIIGSTGVIDFRALIGEFNDGNSNGVTAVELRILKNPNLVISFDNTLTTLNGAAVNNADWTYDGTHPSLHKFIYVGNGGIFQKSTAEFIGINAVYNPEVGGKGLFPLKVTIRNGAGGETNGSNNDDIDYINYVN